MTAATLERQPFLGVTTKPPTRKYTPWKPSLRDTLGSLQHCLLNELTYRHKPDSAYASLGLEYSFWSLAPIVTGVRRGDEVKTHEFVWLLLDSEPGAVYHALVNRETGEIAWRDNGSRTHLAAC